MATLLAFIDKYGVPTNQWTWLYEALLEVSMAKIALWIPVCADDWADESAIKASNGFTFYERPVSCFVSFNNLFTKPQQPEIHSEASYAIMPTLYVSTKIGTIEFSLNRTGFQWIQRIQGNWIITEAWIGLNLKILTVTCVFMALC